MTREEEKIIAARERADRHEIAEMELYKGDKCNYSYARIYNTEIASFEAGVEWADEHPKSPWISVNDDLPCNHEEFIVEGDTRFTIYVLIRIVNVTNGEVHYRESIMTKYLSKEWIWTGVSEKYKVTHWMPIPELPKE